jgi:hypothetical protein
MLTKAKAISLFHPILKSISILILGKTPLGINMKNITATVFSVNQRVPLSISCVVIGSPGTCIVSGPAYIPSVIISAGNGGTTIGPCQPPRNKTTNNPANAYSLRYVAS